MDTIKEDVKYKDIMYPILSLIWWIAVWQLSEVLLKFLVKESLLLRFGISIAMLSVVFIFILVKPEIINRL